MSEYQYYEFLAIDRPLNEAQQAAVRATSTRARITATSFVNEYHFGDYSGDQNHLMERYYDAHLYTANWGTRRFMLRLPREVLDLDTVEEYCVGDQVAAWTAGRSLILDMSSEDEPDLYDDDQEALLPAMVGVRAELADGDMRPLYLAWLAGFGTWERDEDAFPDDADDNPEPPVPPGLSALSAPQRALADFLRLDDDLLAVAAEACPSTDQPDDDPARLADWVAALPAAEKDRSLVRLLGDRPLAVRAELLRRYREGHTTGPEAAPRRTVADLLDGAATRRAEPAPTATAMRRRS